MLLGALLLALLFLVVLAWLTLPLSDVLNRLLRRVGLAGPSRGTRACGVRQTGRVDRPFREDGGRFRGTVEVGGELWTADCPRALAGELHPGDPVEVVYEDDLTVRVLGRADT